jgi:hypothetical protein
VLTNNAVYAMPALGHESRPFSTGGFFRQLEWGGRGEGGRGENHYEGNARNGCRPTCQHFVNIFIIIIMMMIIILTTEMGHCIASDL